MLQLKLVLKGRLGSLNIVNLIKKKSVRSKIHDKIAQFVKNNGELALSVYRSMAIVPFRVK